jgi:hypothetical protein
MYVSQNMANISKPPHLVKMRRQSWANLIRSESKKVRLKILESLNAWIRSEAAVPPPCEHGDHGGTVPDPWEGRERAG